MLAVLQANATGDFNELQQMVAFAARRHEREERSF